MYNDITMQVKKTWYLITCICLGYYNYKNKNVWAISNVLLTHDANHMLGANSVQIHDTYKTLVCEKETKRPG
jgi:hypothetical protein